MVAFKIIFGIICRWNVNITKYFLYDYSLEQSIEYSITKISFSPICIQLIVAYTDHSDRVFFKHNDNFPGINISLDLIQSFYYLDYV